jgi:hypothetical protein
VAARRSANGQRDFDVLDDDDANATYRNMAVDQIEDARIVRNGRVIGEVEAILGDVDGAIAAVVAELDAGQPPSAGGTEVVVPIEALEFVQTGFAQLDLDDVELAALRRWEE